MEELKGNYALEEELLLAKAKIKELEDFNLRVMLFDDTLYQIKEEIRNKHGEEFFDTTVLSLQKAIKADFVLIGILDDDSSDNIITLSICRNSEIIQNITYPLMDSPFETIYGKDMSLYPEDLQEIFPNDSILKELNLNAFIGLSLFNSESVPIGIVAALYKNPIDDPDFYQSIMNFFEERIGNEVEKYLNELVPDLDNQDEMQIEREMTQMYLDLAGVIMIVIGRDQKVKMINRKGCELLECEKEYIIGKNWFDNFLPQENIENVKKVFDGIIAGNNKTSEYYENQIISATGKVMYIAWHNTYIHDEEGKIFATLSSGEDISERKKAEIALGESEHRYSEIFNSANEAYVIQDLETGKILDVNETMLLLYGYDTKEEALQCSIADLSAVEEGYDEQKIKEMDRKAIESKSHSYEWRSKRKNGDIFWSQVSLKKILVNGTERILATVRDISLRKHAVLKLEENEENFRAFFNNSLDMNFVLDTSWNIVRCNEIAANKLGYEEFELTGKSFLTLYPFDRKEEAEKVFDNMIESNIELYSIPLQAKYGNLLDVESRITQGSWNGQKAWFIMNKDVTDLRLSEEKFSTAFHINPFMSGITDFETGKYLIVNDEFCQKLGYSRDEVIGFNAIELGMITKEQRLNLINEVSSKGHLRDYEITIKTKNNTELSVLMYMDVMNLQNSKVLYATVVDITEQKQNQQDLVHSHELMKYIIEHTRSAVAVFDNDLEYIYVSQRYIEEYRLPEEDIVGRHLYDVFPEIPEKWKEIYRRSLLGEILSSDEDAFIRIDGTIDWVCWECRPWYKSDSEIGGIILYTEVISERIYVERALKESEEKYRYLLELLPDGVIVHQDGIIVFGNSAAINILKYDDASEVLGNSVIDFVHPDYRELALNRIKLAYKDGMPVPTTTEIFLCKDGSSVELEVNAQPILYENKLAMQVVFRDVSERNKAELALKEKNELLSLFIKNSPIYAFIKEVSPEESCVLYASDNFADMVGIPGSEMVGKNMFDLFPAEFAQKITTDDWTVVSNGDILSLDEEFDNRYYITIKFPVHLGNQYLLAGYTIDITDRKNAEIAIFESESKFRILFETMSQGVVYHDSDGSIISVNPAAERILGLTKEQLMGSSSFDPRWKLIREDGSTIPPEEQASMIALTTGNEVKNMIKGVYRPDSDDYVWISVDAVPQFKDNEERPYQVYAIFNDITERRATLLAMEESEKKYRHIFTTLTDALFVIDLDGTIIDVNPAAIKLYGYTYQEIIGLHTSLLITTEYHIIFNDFVQSVIKNGTFHGETIDKRKDGSTFFTDVIGTKIQYKGKYRLLAIVRDVTDTKNAHRILEESEKRFRSLFENMDDGFVLHEMIFDENQQPKDYIFLEINDAYERITGLNRENVIGKTVCEILQGVENEPADWIGKYGKVVLSGESLTFENYSESIGKWYHVTAYKATGNQFAVLVQDITERKLLENRIQRINEELELKVSERTSQLENTMNELTKENEIRKQIQDDLMRYQKELQSALEKEKELNQLKSAFMSMVSHQYRTPLTIIQTSTELLAKYFITGNQEKHDKHIRNISESIDRMVEMLEKIMAIGKSDINEKNIIPEKFNIVHLINTSIDIIKGYDRNQHNIAFDFSDDTIEIFSKKFYIEQIVNNLLSNAIKYSNPGTTLTIECNGRKDFVKLIISDEGIGIPEQDLKHLFDHFYRASNVETIYGTGLGLSIVKRFTESIKAEIFIESVQNKGTKITLLIPKNNN